MKRHWYVKNKWGNRAIRFSSKEERDRLVQFSGDVWIPVDSKDYAVQECKGHWKKIGGGAIACYLD